MSKRTVLISEKEGIVSLDLVSLFKNTSLQPVLAKPTENLLELYNLVKPDLVVADLHPGEKSNEEALKEIRKINNTPIILLSGTSKSILERLSKSLSPCSYLGKPFDRKELLKIVEDHLSKREKSRL